jgi:hypothetical protein
VGATEKEAAGRRRLTYRKHSGLPFSLQDSGSAIEYNQRAIGRGTFGGSVDCRVLQIIGS